MTERNAEYADARVKVDNVVRARENVIGSLAASYHAYDDLLTNTTALQRTAMTTRSSPQACLISKFCFNYVIALLSR